MSALAGVYYWDGRPVAEADVAALDAACRPGGPDGGGTARPQPGLVLQAHVLHFDSYSKSERQPYIFDRGSVLTWDGRLDNRDDLLLMLHDDVGADVSDAALVAAGYRRWGLDALLPRLLGDWSFALWDGAASHLVLARDYMGHRPLYYRDAQAGLLWASSLAALTVDHPACPLPDDTFIATSLLGGMPRDITPYQGVRQLRAGHVLVATPTTGIRIRRYWIYEPATIRYRDSRTYTEQLRVLLTDAVRVRLRTTQRVWAHLSGGWDSSSVVCLAHRLIQRQQVDAPALQPLSVVISGSPESDESAYIGAVERWCGLSTIRYEFQPLPSFATLLARRWPGHYMPFEAMVQAAGDRVILTGTIGDLIMAKSAARQALLEPLEAGHAWQTLQLCMTRSRAKQRPLLTTLYQLARLVYFPQRLQRALNRRYQRRQAGAVGGPRHPSRASAVSPAVRALIPPPQADPPLDAFPRSKRELVSRLYRVADKNGRVRQPLDLWTWRTDPYSHRPLVEFMLAAPTLAFWDPRVARAGMGQALADVLPPEIRKRQTKGNPQAAFTRARRDWPAALAADDILTPSTARQWELVRRGYLEEQALVHELATWKDNAFRPLPTVLVGWIHLEAWLRSLSVRPSSTIRATEVRPADIQPVPSVLTF